MALAQSVVRATAWGSRAGRRLGFSSRARRRARSTSRRISWPSPFSAWSTARSEAGGGAHRRTAPASGRRPHYRCRGRPRPPARVRRLENLWLAAALAPVLLLTRLDLRPPRAAEREMAMALETFSNIVDERDPTTHGHSVRVRSVRSRARDGLGLPRPRPPVSGGPDGFTTSARVRSTRPCPQARKLDDAPIGPPSRPSAASRRASCAASASQPRRRRRSSTTGSATTRGLLRRAAHTTSRRRTFPDRGRQLRR